MKWGAIAIAAFLLVAAILQVGNTIRMAAFARRKEIGIMRLVGASNLYISLPFLMETLVAALIGVALSGGHAAGVHVRRDLRQAATRPRTSSSGSTGRTRYVAIGGHRGARRAAHPAADTRDDPQIPQSLSRLGYGRAVHSFPR